MFHLGGHAHVDDNAIIGGNSAVQQFTRVGKFAMIGGMCGVVRDVIPYGIAHGNRIHSKKFIFLVMLIKKYLKMKI